MGSEAPAPAPHLVLHITGFKGFKGVDENPTESIMIALKEALMGSSNGEKKEKEKDKEKEKEKETEKEGILSESVMLPSGIRIGSVTILEVAGYGALPALQNLLDSALMEKNTNGLIDEQIVWIHMGVNSGASRLAIERRAMNEATFRCADEMGWQPQRAPIVHKDGEISNSRETTIPVAELVDTLSSKGYDVMVSNDAGRFVCNYVYYQSLYHASFHGTKSLFVHVPLFSKIDENTQIQFVISLFEALASLRSL